MGKHLSQTDGSFETCSLAPLNAEEHLLTSCWMFFSVVE